MTEQEANHQTTTSSNNTEETTATTTELSSPAIQKRKLTDEEKREILRKRRLEKIKGNGESRINKLLYGDSAPLTSTQSEPVEVKPELVNDPVAINPVVEKAVEDEPSHPSPIEALNNLINQKVEETYSPLFKLHDPRLIEKETREYEQPITSIVENDTTREEPEATIPNLSYWNKEGTVKARQSIFERLRPLFILILSFICAVSTIYHNEQLQFGAKGLDTLLQYFGKVTPVTVLISFELAIILPGLLSGKSIFSMHTESALDMFLFAKGIWVSIDRFISDIVLFLFVYIVSSALFNHLSASLKPQAFSSMEDLQQQIEKLLKQ